MSKVLGTAAFKTWEFKCPSCPQEAAYAFLPVTPWMVAIRMWEDPDCLYDKEDDTPICRGCGKRTEEDEDVMPYLTVTKCPMVIKVWLKTSGALKTACVYVTCTHAVLRAPEVFFPKSIPTPLLIKGPLGPHQLVEDQTNHDCTGSGIIVAALIFLRSLSLSSRSAHDQKRPRRVT